MTEGEIIEDEIIKYETKAFLQYDGKLCLFTPSMVRISGEDYEKLKKGLDMLAEKYPAIHKECFVDGLSEK
jgi:hypothetical protein